MDLAALDIWKIVIATGFTMMGATLRYIFMQLQKIVEEDDIRQLIADHIAPEKVKNTLIYDRLIAIERKLDRLMEERMRDNGRDRDHQQD